jgi:hypothetical protein
LLRKKVNSGSIFAFGLRGEVTVMRKDLKGKSRSEPSVSPVLAHALSHPVRVQLLECLSVETASPNMLAKTLGIPLGDAAYHLKRVLDRECGLVEVVKRRKRRGAIETLYRVDRDAFRQLVDWDSMPPVLEEALKGSSLRAFLNVLSAALREGNLDAERATLCWQPVAIDDPGWIEVQRVLSRAEVEIRKALAESTSRLASESAPVHGIVGIAAVEVIPGSRDEANGPTSRTQPGDGC